MSTRIGWKEVIYNNWLQSLEDRGIMPKGTTTKFKMIVEEEELNNVN